MHTTRRQYLASAAVAVGGPLFAPIVAKIQAESAGAPLPKRLVFVVEGNGLPWAQIQPRGIERDGKSISTGSYTTGGSGTPREAVIQLPLADRELPLSLEPLAKCKHLVTIMQGLSGKMNGGGHSNDFGALGAYNSKGGVGSSGLCAAETIDYALGRRLSKVYPQVGIGISDRSEDSVIYNCSAAGRGKPLPTQCRPDLAYEALFGFAAGGDARKDFDTKKNLLDYLVRDVQRATGELAGGEREKLETYLAAFEGMRERHGKLVEMEGIVRQHRPSITNKFKSAVETDRLDAQFDVAIGALVSGLTNVVTIASGAGNPYFSVKFTGLGINIGKHGIGHGGSYNGLTWDVMATKIRNFHFQLIARLVEKLGAVREGDGSMMDNTLIVYLSDAAEGHHSRCWEWPVVLVGNLGGRIKSGQYLELPNHGTKHHRHLGNLYTTLLNAVGDPRESFGHPDPLLGRDVDQRGPIAQLLV